MDECRNQFEELMSAPPYEMNLRRCTEESAWPGNYRDYKVQLAWCAWEELWNRRAEQAPEVALYHELLFAVASKFPNESRHQTALRYINSAEHGQTKVGTMLAPEVKQ